MNDNQTTKQTDELFSEEIGAIVLESAALKFLSTADPEEQEAFQNFIEENAAEEDLIEKIGQKYPTFLTILQDEAATVQKEIQDVTSFQNRS